MALRITIDDEVLATLASKFGRTKGDIFQILFEFGKRPEKVD